MMEYKILKDKNCKYYKEINSFLSNYSLYCTSIFLFDKTPDEKPLNGYFSHQLTISYKDKGIMLITINPDKVCWTLSIYHVTYSKNKEYYKKCDELINGEGEKIKEGLVKIYKENVDTVTSKETDYKCLI